MVLLDSEKNSVGLCEYHLPLPRGNWWIVNSWRRIVVLSCPARRIVLLSRIVLSPSIWRISLLSCIRRIGPPSCISWIVGVSCIWRIVCLSCIVLSSCFRRIVLLGIVWLRVCRCAVSSSPPVVFALLNFKFYRQNHAKFGTFLRIGGQQSCFISGVTK